MVTQLDSAESSVGQHHKLEAPVVLASPSPRKTFRPTVVVLKLELESESAGGHAKTQIAGLYSIFLLDCADLELIHSLGLSIAHQLFVVVGWRGGVED